MGGDVPIRPASTVILVRDGTASLEVLLVRRAAELAFHGGSWVFPGGRIDDEDYPAARPSEDPAAVEVAARRAAVREAHEEAGLHLGPDELLAFAHWTTPPGRNRRFSTWFYLAPTHRGEVVIDGAEIQDHRWARPDDALEARHAGEIELPAPTFVSLLRLAGCASVADAVDHVGSYPYLRFTPNVVEVPEGHVSLYPGDIAFEDVNRFHEPEPRHRLWMVAPRWRYERG